MQQCNPVIEIGRKKITQRTPRRFAEKDMQISVRKACEFIEECMPKLH
jgi:hypothetical protein